MWELIFLSFGGFFLVARHYALLGVNARGLQPVPVAFGWQRGHTTFSPRAHIRNGVAGSLATYSANYGFIAWQPAGL